MTKQELEQKVEELEEERDFYLKNRDSLGKQCNLLFRQLYELPKKICDEIREQIPANNTGIINKLNNILDKIQAKYEE